jgi:hypothetical protein
MVCKQVSFLILEFTGEANGSKIMSPHIDISSNDSGTVGIVLRKKPISSVRPGVGVDVAADPKRSQRDGLQR